VLIVAPTGVYAVLEGVYDDIRMDSQMEAVQQPILDPLLALHVNRAQPRDSSAFRVLHLPEAGN
jgi:hypothetical protein